MASGLRAVAGAQGGGGRLFNGGAQRPLQS